MNGNVRTTRGLFATLGASGSLVAGGACLLLLASAVIAFRGWPSVPDVTGASRSLVVSGETGRDTPRDGGSSTRGAARAVAPIVVGGRTVARRAAGRRSVSAGTRRPGASVPAPAAGSVPAPAQPARASTSTAATPGSTSSPSTPAGSLVRRSASDTAAAVSETGRRVTEAVPAAGPAVQQTTTATADAVNKTGETAAQAVDGLLGGK